MVFLVEWSLPERELHRVYYLFGLLPAAFFDPHWRDAVGTSGHDYTTIVTSLFLHGSWLHLITNMWMLWIFGDNVEDRMGPLRYLCFFIFCGTFAGALQIYFNPYATVPIVGASGALAGIMGAYFVMYPYARVIIWVFMLPLFIQLPAIAFLGAWIIFQLYNATSGLVINNLYADVAWWGHLGGFLTGAAVFRWFVIPGRGYGSTAEFRFRSPV
jgi:membrane associated rhomboid family serine protease